MAKLANSVSFKNAIISLEDNSIVEVTKDAEYRYSLSEVVERFNEKMVSLTIKEEGELPLAEEE